MDIRHECSEYLTKNKISKKFYEFLKNKFKQIFNQKNLSNLAYLFGDINDMADEFVNEFCLRLNYFCSYITRNDIENIEGFVYTSILNFVYYKIKGYIKLIDQRSLNAVVSNDDSNTEYIDLIPSASEQENDAFVDVLADDFFKKLLDECEKMKSDMKRKICFLLSVKLFREDKFMPQNISRSNKYKIIQRAKGFLKDFQDRYSVEDEVMGKILERFVSEICSKDSLKN